jgi:hypothetical protein
MSLRKVADDLSLPLMLGVCYLVRVGILFCLCYVGPNKSLSALELGKRFVADAGKVLRKAFATE